MATSHQRRLHACLRGDGRQRSRFEARRACVPKLKLRGIAHPVSGILARRGGVGAIGQAKDFPKHTRSYLRSYASRREAKERRRGVRVSASLPPEFISCGMGLQRTLVHGGKTERKEIHAGNQVNTLSAQIEDAISLKEPCLPSRADLCHVLSLYQLTMLWRWLYARCISVVTRV